MLLLALQAAALLVPLLLLPYYLMFMTRRARLIQPLPGPKPLPFLGNVLEFGRNGTEIMTQLARLGQKYGYFYRAWFGPFLYIVVAHPKEAEVFITSNVNITKSLNYKFLQPWLGLGLLTSTGHKWKSHRKLLTPTFHFKILEEFVDVFNFHGNVMIQKLKTEVNGPEFDVHKYITLCTLDSICEAAMGVSMHVQDNKNNNYVKALKNVGDIVMRRSVRPWLFPNFIFNNSEYGKQQRASIQILHDTSNEIIANRKKEFYSKENGYANKSQENEFGQKFRLAFLDLLLQYQRDGGNLTDEEIREEVDTFMFEGHDTVSSGLGFCLWLLAKHPQCQERAYEELYGIFGDSNRDTTVQDLQEMKYLECVIKETLRLYPSVAIFLRELDEDVKLDTCLILAGTTIAFLPYFMHRHPDYFPEPEKFDPDRFSPDRAQGRNPYAYIPFSAGPRNCIGQRFAMMEMKSLVSKVLRYYKLLPGTTELVLCSELVLRSVTGINIKLENRK
ncbi:hypothetical protein R5R35_010202 [Gryllus longicercus]|uniref:Cytochrome P450 n=1 Tax=Gryllus longicercus TaxID=2509291 RepID=A0AAN9VU64_9ORTH